MSMALIARTESLHGPEARPTPVWNTMSVIELIPFVSMVAMELKSC